MGTVFRISKAGELQSLHSFNLENEANPDGMLMQAADGNFYGTTRFGGATVNEHSVGHGTIFTFNNAGSFSTLVNFMGTNGSAPYSGLIQGQDGQLYGTTSGGGESSGLGGSGEGVVFRLTLPLALNFKLDGTSLVLSWAKNAGDVKLQSAPELNKDNDWIEIESAQTGVGAVVELRVPLDGVGRFYRLKQ